MASAKSTKVPKKWEGAYAELTRLTDNFCVSYLDDDYATLARHAVAALYRKRPTPLASGKPETWACAVIYALGQVNFLSDKSFKPYMAMSDLAAAFGIASSTAGNKAKLVRHALGIRQLDHNWMLESLLDKPDSTAWLINFDGYVLDARVLPIEVQKDLFDLGVIPYIVDTNGDDKTR